MSNTGVIVKSLSWWVSWMILKADGLTLRFHQPLPILRIVWEPQRWSGTGDMTMLGHTHAAWKLEWQEAGNCSKICCAWKVSWITTYSSGGRHGWLPPSCPCFQSQWGHHQVIVLVTGRWELFQTSEVVQVSSDNAPPPASLISSPSPV